MKYTYFFNRRCSSNEVWKKVNDKWFFGIISNPCWCSATSPKPTHRRCLVFLVCKWGRWCGRICSLAITNGNPSLWDNKQSVVN